MAMFAATARILTVMLAGCLSFKLSEPSAGKQAQAGFGDPGIEEGPPRGHGSDGGHGLGLGGLGKNLNFLLVKVAQLEALAEMQQAEIATHRLEIASLKEGHRGPTKMDPSKLEILLEEMQTRSTGAAGLDEATALLKKVWHKHEHQRRTRAQAAGRGAL